MLIPFLSEKQTKYYLELSATRSHWGQQCPAGKAGQTREAGFADLQWAAERAGWAPQPRWGRGTLQGRGILAPGGGDGMLEDWRYSAVCRRVEEEEDNLRGTKTHANE